MTSSSDKGWPMLLDMTKQECKQTLRALELSAYSKLVSVLRAQGEFTKEKKKLLLDLQGLFSIPIERHRAEIRRAVNDEVLHTVAYTLAGPNTQYEWTIEGRRLIPLMRRVPPKIAYTALATRMAEVYCGINTRTPKPCETAMFGKLDDVGADIDFTDSEEETEGLRYITEAMIPRHINPLQGSYTTLPHSQMRVANENKRKKEEEKQQLDKESRDDSSMEDSPPLKTSPSGGEKRKRKRSNDQDTPTPPPPPPAPMIPGVTQASSLLNFHHTSSIRQIPTLNQPAMKITVTGALTRGSTPPIATPLSQKVILVSTTASSLSAGPIYQRSINIPILKSSSQVSLGALSSSEGFGHQNQQPPTAPKGMASPASGSASILGVGSSLVSKIRPRFSSMTSSILSQGSSSLPGLPPRPPRQRSNSLIVHAEGHPSFSSIPKKDVSMSRATSGPTILPDSSTGGPLNFLGSSNLQHLRGGGSTIVGPTKTGLQVKTDGSKVVSSMSGVLGSRMVGRPPSAQGVYVMSTNSDGTITVVTRTVASAGSLSSPRLVTVNTVSNTRSSIIRGPSPTTVVSMVKPNPIRQTTTVRPATGPKSNVIVVHKGTIPNSPRPIQGVRPRELPVATKIFAKPLNQSLSGTGNIVVNPIAGNKILPSNLLTGTLVVKPGGSTGKTVSITNTKNESSSSGENTSVSTNLLVLDFNQRTNSPTAASSPIGTSLQPIEGKSDKEIIPEISSSSACSSSTQVLQDNRPITVSETSCESREKIIKTPDVLASKKATSDEDEPDAFPRQTKRQSLTLTETDEDNEWLKLGLELEEEHLLEEGKPYLSNKEASDPKTSINTEPETSQKKEGEMEIMVEKLVEALNDGDSSEARSLLHKAGFELIDPACADDNYAISSLPGSSAPSEEASTSDGIPSSGMKVEEQSNELEKPTEELQTKKSDESLQ